MFSWLSIDTNLDGCLDLFGKTEMLKNNPVIIDWEKIEIYVSETKNKTRVSCLKIKCMIKYYEIV